MIYLGILKRKEIAQTIFHPLNLYLYLFLFFQSENGDLMVMGWNHVSQLGFFFFLLKID